MRQLAGCDLWAQAGNLWRSASLQTDPTRTACRIAHPSCPGIYQEGTMCMQRRRSQSSVSRARRHHMVLCGSSCQMPFPLRKACTRSFPFRSGTRRECTAGRMPALCHSDIALWHSLSSSSRWRSGLIYRSRIRSKKLGPIRYQTYQGCTAGTMPDQ